jgi:hypothetical protein
MPKAPNIYRRMPGRGATLTHYVRLYQGPDHLLQVSSTGYSEHYKRFYFQDIQAVTVRKTDGGKVFNALWAIFSGLIALIGLSAGGMAAQVLLAMAALFLVCLLINIALGPTCVCHVRTAVQTEKLPIWRRVKVARKGLARIKSLIEAVQGNLSAEELVRRTQQAQGSGVHQPAAPPVIQEGTPAPTVISTAEHSGNT